MILTHPELPIELRPWHMGDLEHLVQLANNPKIARNLTNAFPYPYTEENGIAFIRMATSHDPQRIFAISVSGQLAGGIGVHPQSDVYARNAELGYWLGEPFWGRGLMTAIIPMVVGYGFRHFDITRIYARPYGSNLASQRVLEKVGFVLEARMKDVFYKNDTPEDELIYAVRRPK